MHFKQMYTYGQRKSTVTVTARPDVFVIARMAKAKNMGSKAKNMVVLHVALGGIARCKKTLLLCTAILLTCKGLVQTCKGVLQTSMGSIAKSTSPVLTNMATLARSGKAVLLNSNPVATNIAFVALNKTLVLSSRGADVDYGKIKNGV